MNIDRPRTVADSQHEVFVGDGEMARLMRAHDWAATSLGPPAHWPQALKAGMRLLLTSRFEMWLGWGPDIAFFYNDAYRPTLGNKHPRALGQPTRILWAEIWPEIEPKLRSVYVDGQATWDRALQLLLNRHGYAEETYHTFSYSPLIGDTGRVEGVFCAVTEDTDRIISERRLDLLRDLASRLATADRRTAVLAAAGASLARNPHDLLFTLVYLCDEAGRGELASATGIEPGDRWAPPALDASETPWNLSLILGQADHALIELEGLPGLPSGAWRQPATRALMVPLVRQGRERARGALVVGLNPHRPFDDDYLGFVQLLAGQLAASLANAEAYEAERERAAALAEAARLRQEAAEVLHRANQRLASEVQQRTEERDGLRALFAQAPGFMCLLRGPDHVFELANEAYLQLVGRRELIGLRIREALPDIEGQGYFELLDEVYRSGQAFVGRNLPAQIRRQPDAAPEQHWLHLTYQPVHESDGRVSGIFVDGHDVTQQKLAEDALQALNATLEQRVAQRTEELADALARLQRESAEREQVQAALRHAQRMESIGALTGGIAHDFNNLLQVISSNLQLLSRHVAGNEQAHVRVQNALAGVNRGAKLASQLLAFGRRQPLEPKVVNIGRFIQGMDDMLRRALGEEIELECVISGGLWNSLVDPAQIENALLNLAINARDAMPDGGRLTLEAGNALLDDVYARGHEDVTAGQYVMVGVTDTGTGMPPDVMERAFEPFFSTKPEGKGTGLGLSMVYGFVKQSGGHMKIYSEVGEGTTVKLYLPRVQQPEDQLSDAAAAPVRGGHETVLVVEDDEDVRESAVATVADLGYRVLKARDAASALHVIDSGVPVDVLFTDVVMPGPLRSPDLARKARERLPDIAVLFTSGYTENAIVHGGRLDPGVELLSKPYTREALARKIRHVLAHQAQRRVARERGGAPPKEVPSTPPRASRPLSVLLVEDDEIIRQSVAMMLGDDGHEVHEASNAVAALKALAAERFDVLMVDIGLPGPSGIDLARQAVARWPGLRIVFATGNREAAEAAQLPGAAVLVKPYLPDDVASLLVSMAGRGDTPPHLPAT